jgi:hypothetical protein
MDDARWTMNPTRTLCAWCGATLGPQRLAGRLAELGLASHGLCRPCSRDLTRSLEGCEASWDGVLATPPCAGAE